MNKVNSRVVLTRRQAHLIWTLQTGKRLSLKQVAERSGEYLVSAQIGLMEMRRRGFVRFDKVGRLFRVTEEGKRAFCEYK